MNYYDKYLKYKNKYLQLTEQYGCGETKKDNIEKYQLDEDNHYFIIKNELLPPPFISQKETYITFPNGYIIPKYYLKKILNNIKYNYFYSKYKISDIDKKWKDPEIPINFFINCTLMQIPNSFFYINKKKEKLYDNYLYGFFVISTYNIDRNIPNQEQLKKFLNAINNVINKNQIMKNSIIQFTKKTRDIIIKQNLISNSSDLKKNLFKESLNNARSKLDNFNLEFNNNIICSCNNTNYLDDMPLNIILKNESGINNIGNSCYFNSTLHLIAPIITNIIYNSDKSKFNYIIKLKTNIIEEDVIRNIVNKTIIPLIYFKKKKNLEKLYDNLINFANIFIKIENNICIIELNEKSNYMRKKSQEDAGELLVRLLDNLASLGYCLKYNYQGLYLIKFILNAQNIIDESARIKPDNIGLFNLSPTNDNYNIQTLINNTIEDIELIKGTYNIIPGKFQITGLLNNSNEMPTFIIFKINLEIDGINKNNFFPNEIENIIINNTIYEPSDIICQSGSAKGGHYICYSKRYINNNIKWILYNDAYDQESFDDTKDLVNMITHMRKRMTPYICSFKKKYIGKEEVLPYTLQDILKKM